jgi:hypothetical protein
MGYNKPTPMPGAAGGGKPAQIWRAFMQPALGLVKDRDWFQVTGDAIWVPFTPGLWKKNPSFDVRAGADPGAVKKDDGAATEDDAKKDDAGGATTPDTGTGEVAPTTPDPTTPAPTTPGPTTPAPNTAAPTAPTRLRGLVWPFG